MRNNVIDLIIYLVKSMHIGVRLKDINLEKFRGYNKSEISAAYSWLIQRYDADEYPEEKRSVLNRPAPRVLHPSEKNLIAPDVYGYLLELYYLGIIDASHMERLIEYSVFRSEGVTDTSDIKDWVAAVIFDSEQAQNNVSMSLKGNETIN